MINFRTKFYTLILMLLAFCQQNNTFCAVDAAMSLRKQALYIPFYSEGSEQEDIICVGDGGIATEKKYSINLMWINTGLPQNLRTSDLA